MPDSVDDNEGTRPVFSLSRRTRPTKRKFPANRLKTTSERTTQNSTQTQTKQISNRSNTRPTDSERSSRGTLKRPRPTQLPSSLDEEIEKAERAFFSEEEESSPVGQKTNNNNEEKKQSPSSSSSSSSKKKKRRKSGVPVPSFRGSPSSLDLNDEDSSGDEILFAGMSLVPKKERSKDNNNKVGHDKGSNFTQKAPLRCTTAQGEVINSKRPHEPNSRSKQEILKEINIAQTKTTRQNHGCYRSPSNFKKPPSPLKGSMDQLRVTVERYLETVDPNKVKLPHVHSMLRSELGITITKALKVTIKALVVEILTQTNFMGYQTPPPRRRRRAQLYQSSLLSTPTTVVHATRSDHNPINAKPLRDTKGANTARTATHTNNIPSDSPSKHCISLLDDEPLTVNESRMEQVSQENQAKSLTNHIDHGRRATNRAVDVDTKFQHSCKTRPRTSKANCTLCNNCPCLRGGAAGESNVFADLSLSDADMEKALIKRLQKLEKIQERYATEEDAVRRKLKTHRRDMWKKRMRLMSMGKEVKSKSFFLPDAEELEEELNKAERRKVQPIKSVRRAQAKLFPVTKVVQPTLTQMMGGKKSGSDGKVHSETESVGSVEQEVVQEFEPENEPIVECVPNNDETGFESDSDIVLESHFRVEPQGEGSDHVSSKSIWTALVADEMSSSFDHLFLDPTDVENSGLDDLAELLGRTQNLKQMAAANDKVSIETLNEKEKCLAQDFMDSVTSNPVDLDALEAFWCDWKENVCFCVSQHDPGTIQGVVDVLLETETRMSEAICSFTQMLEKRKNAVRLFCKLLQSVHSSKCAVFSPDQKLLFSQAYDDLDRREPELKQLPTPKNRRSIESEVPTLAPSDACWSIGTGGPSVNQTPTNRFKMEMPLSSCRVQAQQTSPLIFFEQERVSRASMDAWRRDSPRVLANATSPTSAIGD